MVFVNWRTTLQKTQYGKKMKIGMVINVKHQGLNELGRLIFPHMSHIREDVTWEALKVDYQRKGSIV